MGDPVFMDDLFHGESENPPQKMDDSRGTPILGNLHKLLNESGNFMEIDWDSLKNIDDWNARMMAFGANVAFE